MTEIDDKDLQAFEELQRRVIDLTEKQKLVGDQFFGRQLLTFATG